MFRPGVAFQFSHVNITVEDYAMANFFKRKYPLFISFYVKNLFWSLFPLFQECEAKICHFLVNCAIFTFLSAPYFQELTIMVHEKNLKKQSYPKCIFIMHFRKNVKKFDTFLWNLGLDP